ncbi:MAG TPA: nitroreductase family protein [Anaerolineae bacterium]|nr:nitroreductase family protein [Anaerolineae bacterium]MCB0222577.1 nitroreductase family protein [Anaerolineae bacterium]HRV96171.1 nitroreductase family protein [Anaerolineae bacterium]
MKTIPSVPLEYHGFPEDEMRARALAFYEMMKKRHSTRDFADKPVPLEVITTCLETAGRAPSGANQQPWHFVVVTDPAIKHQIRLAAEAEERTFYTERASEEWLNALAPLGTDADKAFIDRAGCLIVIFAQAYGLDEDGDRIKHYYVQESVGIATGFLIAALHNAGLACLTHTPSPMNFLAEILGRPKNERAYINLVVGYPADDAQVPLHATHKKALPEFVTFV